jgi:PAS domain S-box-containing protein
MEADCQGLPERQGLFGLLFESSSDAILIRDLKAQRIIDCNEAAVRLNGCSSKAELINRYSVDLTLEFQPDGRRSEERIAEIARLAREKGSHSFEWVGRRKDGQLVEMEATGTFIQLGERSLLVTICRDVSQRKRMENSLRESEQKFRLLFENSADAILIIDPQNGLVVDCNNAAIKMAGAESKASMISQPLTKFSPELQPDGGSSDVKILRKIEQVMSGGSYHFEWLAKTFTGHEIQMEVLATVIELGGRRLMATVSREISERKKAEARIQQLNQELEARVRERTIELVQTNEHLKTEIKQRRRKEKIQQALFQISEAIHTTEDLDSLYQQIHSSIQGAMTAHNFYIALHDSTTDLVHFAYFVDEVDQHPAPLRLTTGPTARVLQTGKALLVHRRKQDESEPGRVALVEPSGEVFYAETGSASAVWLGVPLSTSGNVFGVMAVQDYFNDKAYGEEEKQILTFIGEQTAQVIQRKRSEQALRESEQKFRALFEASSQAVMLHDEKQFLEVNPATVRILGFNAAEEIIGKHPAELAAPIQANGEPASTLAPKHIQDCMTRGYTRFEWIARNTKGIEIPVEVLLTRVQTHGKFLIQAVVNDISERKRAEAELLRALAREKELGQLKGNFISMVSHEFRTPLGVIMSSAEILESYLEQLAPEERREHLQSIHKNTRRMAELMEEVLLLGMAEAGKMDFKPEPIDFEIFCRRLTDDLLSATDRKCPVQFQSHLLSGKALADERLLRHIFTNLLTNAVKYSLPNSLVRFEVEREGNDVVCRVADQGIGIPEQDQEWLFKAFHRGRNVGNLPGTGLGLVIVKRCVELHGGQIKVESTVGKGTTVTVRFPVFAKE